MSWRSSSAPRSWWRRSRREPDVGQQHSLVFSSVSQNTDQAVDSAAIDLKTPSPGMPQSGSKPSFVRAVGIPALALTFLILMAWCPALAQGTDAAIQGRVVGEKGAPIGDVIISVHNGSNGFTSSTRSTSAGYYVFAQLPLGGPYDVSARHMGFEP